MKWFMRIIFIIFAIILSIMVHFISLAERQYSFLTHNMAELNENYDRTKYIETIMTDNVIVDSYLKDPIYLAVSEEVGFEYELGIYQYRYIERGKELYVSMLYFKDFDIDYLNQLKSNSMYQNNNDLVNIMVSIYYDDLEDPVVGFISTKELEMKPYEFATITTNDSNEVKYMYLNSNTGQIVERSYISKIEINIYNTLNNNQQITNLTTIEHQEVNNNEGISQIVAGQASNFNGNVSYQDLSVNYDNDSLLGNILEAELAEFNYIRVRINVIYYTILVIVTYLIFFLAPTIEYIKFRKVRNRYKQDLQDK